MLWYISGIKPLLVPNACYYLQDSYKPTRKHFLVTPIHSTELSDLWFMKFDEALMKHQSDIQVKTLKLYFILIQAKLIPTQKHK